MILALDVGKDKGNAGAASLVMPRRTATFPRIGLRRQLQIKADYTATRV